jgi:hypothetical protein
MAPMRPGTASAYGVWAAILLFWTACSFDAALPGNIRCETSDDCRRFGASATCALDPVRGARVCCLGPGCHRAADAAVDAPDGSAPPDAVADASGDLAQPLDTPGDPAVPEDAQRDDSGDVSLPGDPRPQPDVVDASPIASLDASPDGMPNDRGLPQDGAGGVQWEPRESQGTGIYESVGVAAGPNGVAVMVLATTTQIWARRRLPAGWDEPFLVATRPMGGPAPLVGIDDAGNAMVTWADGSARGVARRFTASAGWPAGWSGEEELWNTPTVSAAVMKMDEAGDAVVAWEGTGGVKLRLYEAGHGWYPIAPVTASGDSVQADLARLGPELRVLVTWRQAWSGTSETAGVFAAVHSHVRETHTPLPASPTQVLAQQSAATTTKNVAVAMDSTGKALALMVRAEATFAKRFDGSQWVGEMSFGVSTKDPTMGMSRPDGVALVAVYACSPCGTQIVRFSPGNNWHGDVGVTSAEAVPLLGVATGNRAVAVWVQSDNSLPSIFGSERRPGLFWTPLHLLEDDSTQRHDRAGLSMHADGTGMAVWLRRPSAGAGGEVWSARLP